MKEIRVRPVRTKRDGNVLKWTDPHDGRPRQMKAAGKNVRQLAEEARKLEDRLNRRSRELTWSEFFTQFRCDYLDDMSRGHRDKCRTMFRRIEAAGKARGIDRLVCSDLTTDLVISVESTMRSESLAEGTVRSNMASLWAMLTWGMDAELIPAIRKPRRRKGKAARKAATKSKGRSLTLEEIERMELAVPEVAKSYEPARPVLLAMSAMRLIGLRLSDAWLFRWDPQEGTHYPTRLDGRNPAIAFADEQKSGQCEEVPLTPEAVSWLKSIEQDAGWVCRTTGARGEHKTPSRLGRIISDAGRSSGIVVKPNGGKGGKPKFASSHDLRRTFAATWHQRLNVSELQKLTRHADSQTLLSYYADAPTDALAAKLQAYVEKVEADLEASDS